jgi:hypothetical protein
MKLKSPQDITDISVAGTNYKPDKNGVFTVDDAHAGHLYQFGFIAAADTTANSETPPPAETETQPPAAEQPTEQPAAAETETTAAPVAETTAAADTTAKPKKK